MNTWFTSDWHNGHEKMALLGRKFSTVEEHDKTILNGILETVKPGDNLYFLGDAFWKYTSQQVAEFMTILKKHKINLHWIIGNHDKMSWTKYGVVKWVGQIKDITIEKQPLTLCHYPLLVYNRSHYSSVNLYGHIHIGDATDKKMKSISSIMTPLLGKSLNVNVEMYNYKPISFEQVMELVKHKPDNFDLIRKEDRHERQN